MTEVVGLDHQFVAITRDDAFMVVWCACGWMAKAGSVNDCFEFHGLHVSHEIG